MAPTATIETVAESVELGEGPHWDVETQSLYFVDIFGGSIHKYVPETAKYTKAVIGKNVSFIVPLEGADDKFAISINRELVVVTWDGESRSVSDIQKLGEVESEGDVRGNRFNDAKADPVGRLWLGTMGSEPENGHVEPNKGSLYSFGAEKVFKRHLTKIGISNGLAWNEEGTKFYYIDSPQRKIFQFDYDVISGTISNQQTIFTFDDHNIPGFPDGQTIDTDGNLWVAVFNGNRVIQIDPRKPETLLETVDIPAKQVTSVAFGGLNLDELYVTSARFTVDGVVLPAEDEHGWTFVVKGLGAKGFPATRVKV